MNGIRISVFLTDSCIARNSFRRVSRACASSSTAALVIAFGGGGAFGFGAIRREPSSMGVFDADRETLESRGAGVAAEESSAEPSSSSANESLLFARGFFFFFLGGPSLRDVDVLDLAISRARANENDQPRLDSPVS
jgi:hypothetical protein